MPRIKCAAKDCLNRNNDTGFCGYTDNTQVDISSSGTCMDYDWVTDEEYLKITGRKRKIEIPEKMQEKWNDDVQKEGRTIST